MKTLDHRTYSISELHRVPDSPGIYAWYLSIQNERSQQDYHKVFKSRSLSTKSVSDLNESYVGDLELKDVELKTVSDFPLLQKATRIFSPPIYIGITVEQTLPDRLGQHRRAINDAIDLNDEDLDQSIFGHRIGQVLQELPSLSISSFFVRVLPLSNLSSQQQVREVEAYLNRTYVPFYGKR